MLKSIINPVLVKELRGRMRGPRAFIILTVYMLVLAVFTILLYTAAVSSSTDPNTGRTVGRLIFFGVCAVTLVQVTLITPSLTAGSIAGEKERQTYDLLIVTLLSPWKIILGKLVSATAYSVLLVVASLPLASLGFLFGGVTGVEFGIAVVGLLVTVIFYASVGLLCSTLMRSTLGATVLAQGLIILKLLGLPFLYVIFGIMFLSGPTPEWVDTYWFIYLAGFAICLHPFFALGFTAAALSSNEGVFLVTVDPGDANLTVPSPWIGYTLLALLISAICIALSVRLLKPTEEPVAGRRGAKE